MPNDSGQIFWVICHFTNEVVAECKASKWPNIIIRDTQPSQIIHFKFSSHFCQFVILQIVFRLTVVALKML
jgi:hypothetical protein